LRFITTTATSAGFPAKDLSIRIHDFKATDIRFDSDLNHDGIVNFPDLGILANYWLDEIPDVE